MIRVSSKIRKRGQSHFRPRRYASLPENRDSPPAARVSTGFAEVPPMSLCRQLVLSVTGMLVAALLAGLRPAQAIEGTTGHYQLGCNGFLAGVMPPEPGTYFQSFSSFYSGGSGTFDLPIAGRLYENVETSVFVEQLRFTHVTGFSILGADWAVAATLPFAGVRTSGTELPGPLRVEDYMANVGDISVAPVILGWHNDLHHWLVGAQVFMPTGDYRTGRLSSTGLNYWTIEPLLGYSFLDKTQGRELTLFLGWDYNTQNPSTGYHSGSELHLDWNAALHMHNLAVGVGGYVYQQVSGDSGPGARLGPFEGRTYALGPQVMWTTMLGIPVQFKYLKEFSTANRVQGETFWINVGVEIGKGGLRDVLAGSGDSR
jgi:hypothetical protein